MFSSVVGVGGGLADAPTDFLRLFSGTSDGDVAEGDDDDDDEVEEPLGDVKEASFLEEEDEVSPWPNDGSTMCLRFFSFLVFFEVDVGCIAVEVEGAVADEVLRMVAADGGARVEMRPGDEACPADSA